MDDNNTEDNDDEEEEEKVGGGTSGGEDIVQQVERRTGTPLTKVRQGNFLPKSTFSADSFTVNVKPRCAIVGIKICVHVKDPVVHVRVVDYGNTTTPSMHRRLGSATSSLLIFPRESKTEFPMGEISVGQHSCER